MCLAEDQDAVSRVRRMKGGPASRPFIMLVEGFEMASRLAEISDPEISAILRDRWPGRLTVVLPALSDSPAWVTAEDGTVALRHPSDALSGLLLRRIHRPLVSTSANLAGGQPALDPADIPRSLLDKADLILDAGPIPHSSPSTIIRLLRGRT